MNIHVRKQWHMALLLMLSSTLFYASSTIGSKPINNAEQVPVLQALPKVGLNEYNMQSVIVTIIVVSSFPVLDITLRNKLVNDWIQIGSFFQVLLLDPNR